MTVFLKTDAYGDVEEVHMGACICSCGKELTTDELHVHPIIDELNEEIQYVKQRMKESERLTP